MKENQYTWLISFIHSVCLRNKIDTEIYCPNNEVIRQSKKKIAMIRNWNNQIPYPALKTKRDRTKYINWQQFTKGTRGKPNEQLFPKQVVIQLPKFN